MLSKLDPKYAWTHDWSINAKDYVKANIWNPNFLIQCLLNFKQKTASENIVDANGVEVASGKVSKPKQLRNVAAANAKDSLKANIWNLNFPKQWLLNFKHETASANIADANGVEVASGKVSKPKQIRNGADANAKHIFKAKGANG